MLVFFRVLSQSPSFFLLSAPSKDVLKFKNSKAATSPVTTLKVVSTSPSDNIIWHYVEHHFLVGLLLRAVKDGLRENIQDGTAEQVRLHFNRALKIFKAAQVLHDCLYLIQINKHMLGSNVNAERTTNLPPLLSSFFLPAIWLVRAFYSSIHFLLRHVATTFHNVVVVLTHIQGT